MDGEPPGQGSGNWLPANIWHGLPLLGSPANVMSGQPFSPFAKAPNQPSIAMGTGPAHEKQLSGESDKTEPWIS